jgi:hypothetical protein
VTPRVECEALASGWRCTVTLGEDPGATRHEVTVGPATLADLAPDATATDLVRESFVFLLEHEPREAIMRTFDLPVIGLYFPEYPDEIRRRMERPGQGPTTGSPDAS